MNRRGPVLTLLAVALLGGVLLAVSVTRAAETATPVAAPPPPTAPAAGAGAAAPAEAPPPAVAEATYAGRSAGGEVTVAIAVKNGHAVAYVCDGRAVEAWLEGTLTGDRLALRGRNGATITGTAGARAALGTVAVGGQQWPYSAAVATAPSGLYEGRADVRGVTNRIGWIVLQDSTEVGIRTAAGTDPQAAPPLDPEALDDITVDGVPVQVRVLTGSDHVVTR